MPYPVEADTVVVQHQWWDDNTRRGVAQNVTFDPLPYSGSNSPNLRVTSAHGWIKTRSWVARPNTTTGYFAVPLTASNDPDLTAFPGYRVSPGGEDSFTIAVDVDAQYTAATQEMVTALAALTPAMTVSVGQMVRAVWLTDVAVVNPSPSPPASFFTADQVTDLVLDAIDGHDADPDAHPDIRALIGSGGGGGSDGGPSDRLVGTRIASTIMSGHRVVTPTSTGSVEYADCTITSHRARPLWMTTTSASSGAAVQVLYTGPVVEPSWSWTPGPVYLGVNGLLTQTPPSAPAFLAQVGYATTATSIHLDRQPSIVLA